MDEQRHTLSTDKQNCTFFCYRQMTESHIWRWWSHLKIDFMLSYVFLHTQGKAGVWQVFVYEISKKKVLEH